MRRGDAMKARLTLVVLALSVGSLARGAERGRIFLNGTIAFGSIDFAQTRTFKEFAEEGKVASQYSTGSGTGFELGLHWRFKGRLGAMASVSRVGRDGTASVSASLPHPLYLDRPRQATTTKEGLSYRETTVHLDFVYAIPSGKRLELFLFAGPSFVDVKTDLVTKLNYRQAYPYDEVSVSGVDLAEVGDSGFGFNLGGGLDYRFGKRFGLGAQVRFTTASAKLAPPQGPTVDIDAGGFQAAMGLRVSF